MSSVLDSVLATIRGKRREQVKTTWQRYAELVDALARGQQVDCDALAIVLDELDKSESDLATDIDNKQRRFELAERYSTYQELSGRIPQLERTNEQAQKAYVDAISKLQPAATKAFDELNAAQTQLGTLRGAEVQLRETCQDPLILEQQADLDARRMELAPLMREASDAVSKARGKVSYLRAKRDEVVRAVGGEPSAFVIGLIDRQSQRTRDGRAKIAAADAKIAEAAEELQQVESHRDQVASEMRGLDLEQRDLDARKLQP